MADDTPQEVADKFLDKLKASPFVMIGLESDHQHSEPMTAQIDDDQPNALFFFAGRDNRLAAGGAAMAQFASKGHDFFACLSGEISRDDSRAQIDKLWNNAAEAYFPQGKDDPNLALLRFDVDGAELWEAEVSLGGKLKMLFGGTIDADQLGAHTAVTSLN